LNQRHGQFLIEQDYSDFTDSPGWGSLDGIVTQSLNKVMEAIAAG